MVRLFVSVFLTAFAQYISPKETIFKRLAVFMTFLFILVNFMNVGSTTTVDNSNSTLTEENNPLPAGSGEGADRGSCFSLQKKVTMSPEATPSSAKTSSASDPADLSVPTDIESREVEKISQWHLFQAKNQGLFRFEQEFIDDINKQIDGCKKIKTELDELRESANCQGKMKFIRIIKILGGVYEPDHFEKIREDVIKTKNSQYMNEVTRLLDAWAHYHLDQLIVLLRSFANDSHTVLYGKIPEDSLVTGVVQNLSSMLGPTDLHDEIINGFSSFQKRGTRCRINFEALLKHMAQLDMLSPVVQYETQGFEPETEYPNQEVLDFDVVLLDVPRTVDHALAVKRILWNKNFVSMKHFGQRYSGIFSRGGLGGFIVTKAFAKVFNEFCQQHGITRLIHLFAGTGMLQAAMKSIKSNVVVTSLDTYVGKDMLKPEEGQKQMVFFSEYDREGVVIEDYGKYLSAHRKLISQDSCLLITFPDIEDEPLRQLKKALQCWGLLGGGMIITLSELMDKKTIYGDLFTTGGLIRKNSDISLPPELVETIPHVTPELFTIQRGQ